MPLLVNLTDVLLGEDLAALQAIILETVGGQAGAGTSGVVSGGAYLDNLDGTISVAQSLALIRSVAGDDLAPLYAVSVPQSLGIALTNLATNYIYVDYNAGTPVYAVTTNQNDINCQDKCLVYIVHRSGTKLHVIDDRGHGLDVSRKSRKVFRSFSRFIHTEGGTVLSEAGALGLAVTAGSFFYTVTEVPHVAFDTSVAGTANANVFTLHYRDGLGGFTEVTGSKVIDTTLYDSGTGTPVAMANNKFGVSWVYIANNDPSSLHVVMGQAEYPDLASAKVALLPVQTPTLIQGLGALIGYVAYEKGATSFADVMSAFAKTFSAANPTSHNSLSALQGGAANDYQHLTTAQLAAIPNPVVEAGTVAGVWEGTSPYISSYYDGLTIPYRIPVAGASTTTLNINGLGAKTVYRWGTSLLTTHYPVDSIVWLTYAADLNGGCFLVQGDYDSTESYTVRWNSNVQNNATDAVGAYRPVLELADGTFGAVVIGSSLAANGNTVSSQTFRLGGQALFYSNTAVVAAGAAFTYVYESIYTTVGEYWTNRGTTAWATAYMPMYLVGIPSADGSTFTLEGAGTTGTGFLTQTLPTTEDGKIYIKFGYMGNTSDGFRMSTDHPIYHYVNGAVTLWGSSDIARLSAPQTFTAAQRGAIATEDNAIDFSAKNNFSLTATAANITATNVASCIGQSGFIEIASAENITGWGTEFTFPDGIGGWSSTNAPSVSGTEVFGYAVVNSTTIRMGRVQ